MRYCPKCQQELPDPIPHFCTKCGQDLSHEIRADGNRQNEGSDRAKRALLWTFSFILAGSLFLAGVMTAVVLKGKDKTPSDSPSAAASREQTSEACSALSLNVSSREITRKDDTFLLVAVTDPPDMEVRFTSSDESVVVVGESGLVTAVGPGSAVITASCGGRQADCRITCIWSVPESTDPPEPEGDLELENPDMTFFAKGESYVQKVKDLPPGTPVIWSSADESIATVDASGHITAVGPGVTVVTAMAGERIGCCYVRCDFGGDNGGDNDEEKADP